VAQVPSNAGRFIPLGSRQSPGPGLTAYDHIFLGRGWRSTLIHSTVHHSDTHPVFDSSDSVHVLSLIHENHQTS